MGQLTLIRIHATAANLPTVQFLALRAGYIPGIAPRARKRDTAQFAVGVACGVNRGLQ